MDNLKIFAENDKTVNYFNPATAYPENVIGDARIKVVRYSKGYYGFEGIYGYDMYRVHRSLPVTCLQLKNGRSWKTWMVNDPLHWYAMEAYVTNAAPGYIMCAGLGLGLMIHHALRRDDITNIVVLELNQNVIDLVSPLLPHDKRVHIIKSDFYDTDIHRNLYDMYGYPDTVLWDLAVGERSETQDDFKLGMGMVGAMYPVSRKMFFGLRNKLGEFYS